MLDAADPRCPMVFTANLTEYAKFRRGKAVNRKLYRKLEEVTTREALFAAGLDPEI